MFPEFTVSDENIDQQKEAVLKQIEENKKEIEKLLEIKDKTYKNFVRPYQLLQEKLGWLFSPISHLNYVKNSEKTQEAYTSVLPALTEYHTSISQDERLYRAFKQIYENEKDTLNQEQKKVLQDLIRDFELSGVGLPEDERKKIKDINIKLSQLQNSFAQNILNATDSYEMIIEDPDDVKELPEIEKDNAKIERDGREVYRFTLHQPSYIAYMTYGSNREKREQLYRAYVTRAPENEKILEEILSLRYEKARILGFKNYAELSLATKMAKSPQQVIDFLRELARKSRPQAEREYEELNEFVKDLGLKDDVQAYDFAYYSEKLKKEKFNVDDEEYKPYFEKNSVVEGLFKFLNRFLKLDFEKVDVPVWDETVDVYHIYRKGSLIGRLYLDLEAREGKRDGAWMDEWVSHHEDEKGNIIPPVAFIVANFSPSTDKNPSLLRPYDVETLFHEMGHALHHLLSEVKEPFVSGIAGVEWDAVEFPSQFFEKFAYDREVLKLFAKHYRTGEPMPEEMMDRLKNAKNFQSALAMVRQLEFALFDMLIHLDRYTAEDVQKILDQVREEVSVIKPPSYNKFQWSFSHIFAGGYAAGYYSYKWAEVLSADAYFMFIDNGIYNDELSESFYTEILSKGGSRPADQLFRNFAGREPDIDALLRLSGIKNGQEVS
ncbi:MAG TPA: M3 family peptidase [Persephonella sp.]|uniref:oligopeptidase A n=1 Tax=Persephonella marina (strain DSM 14350 / EX-H1) TaxID=123214 RepID=C0QU31_PERMH|nr:MULTISPECIES: M3 family metallopeptidase [Persephonella]ACO03414.1 oligopeptidase A [Persephonella marina EX-H1]HCB70187.1 M3 family peptidase [Persephonella sp.]